MSERSRPTGLERDAARQIVPGGRTGAVAMAADGRKAVALATAAGAAFAPMMSMSLSAASVGAAIVLASPGVARAEFLGPDGVTYNTSCDAPDTR